MEEDCGQAVSDIKAHFFDLSLDLLCILDAQGKIQEANRAFRINMQAEPLEICEKPFIQFVYTDDQAVVLASLDELSASQSRVSFVCRHRCHDAVVKWHLWTFYPQPSGVVHGIGRDVTPYKQMELKEQERTIFAEALLDTGLAINSSLALDQVLDRILANTSKIVAYEYVTILLVEADSAEVVGTQNIVQNHGAPQSVKGQRFAIKDNQHLRYMLETRESVIIPEIDEPPAWITVPETAGLGAFLGAPIVLGDEVIGFLCVFNTRKEFFTPLHAQQLITFANQAGIAINNARLYAQAQSAAVLQERQRMAQELHDSVNQDLFAASTYADLLPKAFDKKPEVVTQYTQHISKLIRGAVDQMRMILIELHPDALTATELEVLIQQLANIFSRQNGLPLNLIISNSGVIFEENVQIAIYRIAQEALHNVQKHANASCVEVVLNISEHDLVLTIEDDGIGFDQEAISEVQFGVSGMRERAYSIGAELVIESAIGQGTKIELRKRRNDRSKTNSHPAGGRP